MGKMMADESPTFEADCGRLLANMVHELQKNLVGVKRVKGTIWGVDGRFVDVTVEYIEIHSHSGDIYQRDEPSRG